MVVHNTPIIAANDDIQMDASARHEKEKIMGEQHKNSRLYSIAETFQFLAAVMLPVGIGMLIKGATAVGAMTFASIGSALAAPAVFVFLGAAAVCTAIAISSRYAASKHFHNATFNATEINAQHTAKYLVQEMKKENSCIQEHDANCRADGKAWTQFVKEQPATQLARN